MRRRVFVCLFAIVPTPDDLALVDSDRANGNFAFLKGEACLNQGFTHEPLVIAHCVSPVVPGALCGWQALPQDMDIVEGPSCANSNARDGILGHVAGDAGFLGEHPIDVAQHGPAAKHRDPAVDDI